MQTSDDIVKKLMSGFGDTIDVYAIAKRQRLKGYRARGVSEEAIKDMIDHSMDVLLGNGFALSDMGVISLQERVVILEACRELLTL